MYSVLVEWIWITKYEEHVIAHINFSVGNDYCY